MRDGILDCGLMSGKLGTVFAPAEHEEFTGRESRTSVRAVWKVAWPMPKLDSSMLAPLQKLLQGHGRIGVGRGTPLRPIQLIPDVAPMAKIDSRYEAID
jgi:hypothetical protein